MEKRTRSESESEEEFGESVVRSKLTLKGGLSLKTKKSSKKKKKRKKEKKRRAEKEREEASHSDGASDDSDAGGGAGAGGGGAAASEDAAGDEDFLRFMTPAQRRHHEVQEARSAQLIKDLTAQTHREKVETFNAKLGSLTEHNDIPRVSAAGNG